jgi:diaminopimelate epimerase
MHNPDGTPDMCGNGLRCAVLLAYRLGTLPKSATKFKVTTPSGVHNCECIGFDPDFASANIRIELGIPSFEPAKIPVLANGLSQPILTVSLRFGAEDVYLIPVNTGTTHCIIFVDDLPSDEQFFKLGPQIEMHPIFPARTSVLWAKQLSTSDYQIRIWERGAGETLGCGTGACAVAAAAIAAGRSRYGEDIEVRSKGGKLTINWPGEDKPILMSGQAKWVFDGAVNI